MACETLPLPIQFESYSDRKKIIKTFLYPGTIEKAFGLLETGWWCLLKRLDNNTENITEIISCCVLHNICQKKEITKDNLMMITY